MDGFLRRKRRNVYILWGAGCLWLVLGAVQLWGVENSVLSVLHAIVGVMVLFQAFRQQKKLSKLLEGAESSPPPA